MKCTEWRQNDTTERPGLEPVWVATPAAGDGLQPFLLRVHSCAADNPQELFSERPVGSDRNTAYCTCNAVNEHGAFYM